jgi:hypothetical protein
MRFRVFCYCLKHLLGYIMLPVSNLKEESFRMFNYNCGMIIFVPVR